MSSQSPSKEREQTKDIPATQQDTLGIADRTSQTTSSDSSIEQESQDNPSMLNEENTGTFSSTPEEIVQQEQTDQEFDADMAKKRNLLSLRHFIGGAAQIGHSYLGHRIYNLLMNNNNNNYNNKNDINNSYNYDNVNNNNIVIYNNYNNTNSNNNNDNNYYIDNNKNNDNNNNSTNNNNNSNNNRHNNNNNNCNDNDNNNCPKDTSNTERSQPGHLEQY
jgi:hypothetical protein